MESGYDNLKVSYWNANGLIYVDKRESIAEYLEQHDVDIMCVAETHLRMGHHEDLSMFNGYRVATVERGYGEKNGGGLLTIVKSNLKHQMWNPVDKEFPGTAKEKTWVLIHEGTKKIGVCFVYLAAQSLNGDEFKEWNRKLYMCIQNDLMQLQGKGYECMLMGDFNGHVGNGQDGIPGNHTHTNSNGKMLQDFIAVNNMSMLNADQSRTTGLFTRSANGFSTILDYAIVMAGLDQDITEMDIDETGEKLAGSDHALIEVKIQYERNLNLNEVRLNENKINIPKDTDFNEFKTSLDEILMEVDWDVLDIEQQCAVLQSSLIDAGLKTFGRVTGSGIRKRRRKITKSVKELKRRKKMQEKIVKRLSTFKARRLAGGLFWKPKEENELQEKLEQHRITAEKLANKLLEFKMKRRHRLREITKMGSRAFWRLVRKVQKQWSDLTTIEDEDGELFTDRMLVEEIVLREISKIFKGQRSKIFDFKGEQLVTAAYTKLHKDHADWINPECEEDKHEAEVCRLVFRKQVEDLVGKMKDTRASGTDDLSTRLFKNASGLFYDKLTSMVNSCLREGVTPQALNVGKMTLIDKKEASLKVSQKRPLTVSSQIQSVITKLLQVRMNKICEENSYYGPTQYGFRSNKSTTDCIWLLLTAVRKARKKKYKISVAFCDLTKAYDSVNREVLYKKLQSIGFGGKVLDLIQSMYFNDCIRIKIGGVLSEPVWFTRGVKQGCCLSPLLFSLYISGLGIQLQATKLGIELKTAVLTSLFFADDLVLISKTSVRGMNTLLKIVDKFCKDMDMSLSVSKTFMLTTGDKGRSWRIGKSEEYLEETLTAKYLGINIRVRGRHMLQREKDIVSTARRHAHAIMSLTRAGLDRSKVARSLWEGCAIPAVLYGSEAMTLGDATTKELEKVQRMVGNFILQVPDSSSKVAGWIDAGLLPIKYRLMLRKSLFYWKLCNKTKDVLLKECLQEVTDPGTEDQWFNDIKRIEEEIGTGIAGLTKTQVKTKVVDAAVQFVLYNKREHPSVTYMPQPTRWFVQQPHVTDSELSKVLNRTRAGNLGLGNRMKNRNDKQYKLCPWCKKQGVDVRLNEPHVILMCPAVNDIQIQQKIKLHCPEEFREGHMNPRIALKYLLGEDGSKVAVLRERAKKIHCIKEAWLTRVQNL